MTTSHSCKRTDNLRQYSIAVLSPHFDDAALSLGGLLSRWDHPLVITAHGGAPPSQLPISSWDRDCGFDSGKEANAVRTREDAVSCAALGCVPFVLAIPDGPYAGNHPLTPVREIIGHLKENASLYLPLGVGQPDHARIRDAALDRIDRRPDITVRFYADLPYAAATAGWPARFGRDNSRAPNPLAKALSEVTGRVGPLVVDQRIRVIDQEWRKKRQAVLAHASQLALISSMDEVATLRPLLSPEGPLRVEMTWRPRNPIDAL